MKLNIIRFVLVKLNVPSFSANIDVASQLFVAYQLLPDTVSDSHYSRVIGEFKEWLR